MTGWAAKRFWTQATALAVPGGFTVHLDARAVRTPSRLPFLLPTLSMAQAAAEEWQAQQGPIQPATMPITRFANSAIEKVTQQFDAVVGVVAAYGETDLLCYRAQTPQALIDTQSAGWEPWLAWAAATFDAPLSVTRGVIPVAQPQASLDRLTAAVAALTPFELAGLHDLVAISGSLVLGLAVARGALDASAAFDLSRIDEHWQAALWGQDEESTAVEALKRADLLTAARFLEFCR